MSPPGRAFSSRTAPTTSSAGSNVELLQVRSSLPSVRDTTYFCTEFMWSANGSPAIDGHAAAMPS